MTVKDIVTAFKEHQLQYGLDGDSHLQELYKWKLVTKQAGHPDTDAEDFYQEIRSLDFSNLCFGYQITAIRHFAEYEPEDYRSAFKKLFEESVDLQERVDTFTSTCEEIWDNKIKKNFTQDTSAMCDERLISCFLTFRYPQKYTFYKNDVYKSLCKVLGVKPQKAGQKLAHFYELLNQYVIPAVERDQKLMDSINAEIAKGEYIQSAPLIAQTALWHNVSKEQKNNKKQYWLFLGGKDAKDYHFEEMYNDGVMALCGWDKVGDLSKCDDIDDIDERRKSVSEYKFNTGNLSNMLHAIANEIKEGDIVLAKQSVSDVVGMGVVTGKYEFKDNSVYGKHCRKINWTHKGLWLCASILKGYGLSQFPAKALTNVTDSKYVSKIIEMIENEDQVSNKTLSEMEYVNPSQEVIEAAKLLDNAGQIILQGVPGCGKTYITTELAVYLCDGKVAKSNAENKKRYKELQTEGRIGFTTFHQSLDYEEFVEGLKPETESNDNEMKFTVQPGIFKRMCTNASNKITSNFSDCYERFIDDIADKGAYAMTSVSGAQFHVRVNSHRNLTLLTSTEKNENGTLTKENIEKTYLGELRYWYGYMMGVVNYLKTNYGLVDPTVEVGGPKKYVLIIDEINRANISKVLGELITLLEKSKRIGNDDEFTVTLPYSGDTFGVPDNLYIIGTMNTADRSLGYIDYAIRRRFAFMTLKAEHYHIREFYNDRGELFNKETKLFTDVKNLIKANLATDFELDDFMLGHSYFMAKTDEDYHLNLKYKIIPLLQEYLRDGILVNKDDIKERIAQLAQ